jgi:sugar phosphate isomerase/epimerase
MKMSLAFGLQLYSVRNALQRDSVGTLEQIAEIGYTNLQLTRVVATAAGITHVAGTMGAGELRRRVAGLGMRIVSLHASIDEQTDWDRLLAFTQEVGSASIAVPIAFFRDRSGVEAYARTLNRYGERCRAGGLAFYYHNHFQEFQVLGGQTVMETLLAQTERELVRFEFDTYWAARGGVDPVAWLRALGGRCGLAHQKDIPPTAQPLNWFDAFGHDAAITLQELLQTQRPDQFAEVGEGTMEVKALLAAMREVGVQYVFVEQDMSEKDEIESIRLSYRNMVQLLQP